MKTYMCKVKNLYMSIFPNDRKMNIHFKPSHYASGNGIFSTSDKELHKAIEETDRFKRGDIIIIVDTTTKEEVVAEKKTSYPDVTTYLQAVRVLVDNYGIERKDIANKDMLRDKVEELNIKFPNYKLKNDTE